jgi:hypothetical protein
VYRAAGDEAKQTEITRFAGVKVPGVSVASYLEKTGWRRGHLQDHGDFYEHYRHFPVANVTAVAEYGGALWASNIANSEKVAVKRCTFRKGLLVPRWGWLQDPALPLGEVDPVALSEVMADLAFVASKAE